MDLKIQEILTFEIINSNSGSSVKFQALLLMAPCVTIFLQLNFCTVFYNLNLWTFSFCCHEVLSVLVCRQNRELEESVVLLQLYYELLANLSYQLFDSYYREDDLAEIAKESGIDFNKENDTEEFIANIPKKKEKKKGKHKTEDL